MKSDLKKRLMLIMIILLAILCIATGYYAFKLKEKYNIANNNDYTEAFSNLVNYVNNVENYLAKAMISKSSEHAAQTLTQIWRDSNLAIVYLSRIPLEDDGLSQTAKFLNQVSDYSYSLSKKNIEGEELTEDDFNNLKSLHDYSVSLESTLNQLSEDLYNGNIKPSEKEIDLEEYKKVREKSLELSTKLLNNLDCKNKKIFQQYMELQSHLQSIDVENQFINGFSLAIKIIMSSIEN